MRPSEGIGIAADDAGERPCTSFSLDERGNAIGAKGTVEGWDTWFTMKKTFPTSHPCHEETSEDAKTWTSIFEGRASGR